jgi:hypothetical protein
MKCEGCRIEGIGLRSLFCCGSHSVLTGMVLETCGC